MLRFIKQTILFTLELCLKLAAPLAAIISMAAPGGFFSKIIAGFRSLPDAVREIIWWIGNIPEIGRIVNDYNTLTAASFNQKYGSGAINYVMDYLNEGVAYLQRVYVNLAEQPITTIVAAAIIFLIFYIAARLVRFVRQEGQGSFVTRYERRKGEKVFHRKKRSEHASME